MTDRRREKIEERIRANLLPASLDATEPMWIPTPYAVGQGPPTCHYCGEDIAADEPLLIADLERCHPECEEAWRNLVTDERGD
jgi:hypothetical protein